MITHKQLTKRVEDWQERLGSLGVGHFRISEIEITEDITKGAASGTAAVTMSDAYDTCSFSFKGSWLEDATEQEIDETIIHEWLHVCFRDLMAVIGRVDNWMIPIAFTDFDKAIDHEAEGIIDRMSRSLYEMYAFH